MANKITAVCQECNVQFEYELKPGFPRKYCVPCGDIKKAGWKATPEGLEPLSGLPTTDVPSMNEPKEEPKVRNTRTAEEITATELTKIVYRNSDPLQLDVLETYKYFLAL